MITSPNIQPKKLSSWVLLSALGILWGSSFLSVKYAIIAFDPLQIASFRLIIGFLVVFVFSLILKIHVFNIFHSKIYWIYCFGVAVLSNLLPFTILAIAQEHLSTVFVGLCMATIPLLIVVLSLFLLEEESFSLKKLIGLLIGLSGSCILVLSKAKTDFEYDQNTNLVFIFLCILATFSYSLGAIIIRKSEPVNLLAFSTHALFIASILSLPFLSNQGLIPSKFDYKSIFAILNLGLLSTGMATIILIYLIKKEGPIFLSLVNFKVPLWSTIFGFLILKEVLPDNFILSAFLILLGIFICRSNKVIKNL